MPEGVTPRSRHRARLGALRERRFFTLLVILIVLLAGSPILLEFGAITVWFEGLMASLLLAASLSLCFERRQRLFALLFGVPTVCIVLGSHAVTGTAFRGPLLFGYLCAMLFLFGVAWIIIRKLFESRHLSMDSMCGAVAGYLFLGLAWSMSYSMIETIQPGSFQLIPSSFSSIGDGQQYELIYYSFVTLTTLGYGDVAPITPTTRTLAWIEAVSGQFYLAIVVASIVSMFVARFRPPQNEPPSGVPQTLDRDEGSL